MVESLNNLQSLAFFLPEFALTAAIVAMFLCAPFLGGENRGKTYGISAIFGILLTAFALIAVYRMDEPGKLLFHGLVALDKSALFIKALSLVTAFLVVLFSLSSKEIERVEPAEYYALLLTLTLALFVMASATNLLVIYLAIEMSSTMGYILTGFLRKDKRAAEAALKYVLYGGAASGVMIYGMSIIYGLTGAMSLTGIHAAIAAGTPTLPLLAASVMCLVGFGYKIAAVPFHMWAPDVYEGAPLPVVSFFSVAPKAAGFVVAIRFFYMALAQHGEAETLQIFAGVDWPIIVAVVSALTMTLGNLSAIPQNNMKRLLAYSSVAHAGYIMMGLAVLSNEGLQAVLFYLVVYMIMNLGAFLVVLMVSEQTGSENIESFRGLGRSHPLIAIAMAVFLFSLTGIPPMAGFIGKVYLFKAVISKSLYWLAIVAVLNSVVSLYYYARVLRAMFLEEGGETTALSFSRLYCTLSILLAIPTLVLGIYWTPLWEVVERSASLIGVLPH